MDDWLSAQLVILKQRLTDKHTNRKLTTESERKREREAENGDRQREEERLFKRQSERGESGGIENRKGY